MNNTEHYTSDFGVHTVASAVRTAMIRGQHPLPTETREPAPAAKPSLWRRLLTAIFGDRHA